MKNQKIDLNKMGLTSLNESEMCQIDGGDVDGLMQGSTPDLSKVVNAVTTTAGFVWGFIKSVL